MIALGTSSLSVLVDEARGAQLVSLRRPGGRELLARYDWRTPAPASRAGTYGSSALDFHAEYRGGWHELFPNAGAESVVDGVPLPFHGELAVAPWEVVRAGRAEAVLTAAARLPLTLERRMRLDRERPVLRIEEVVRNEGVAPVAFLWGHHPAFDAVPGSVLDVPARSVEIDASVDDPEADLLPGGRGEWPRVPGRDGGGDVDLRAVPDRPARRFAYLPDLAGGWAALRGPAGDGVALAWDRETFPHAWLWEEIGTPGFPWYGRSRIVALEPQSAWPADGLAAAIARGRAHRLEPGAERRTWLTVALLDGAEEAVTAVDRDGRVHFEGGASARLVRRAAG